MSLLIEDKLNTIEGIEEALKNNGQYATLVEWNERGIKLTPIQANMLLLDYPNFGDRAYGKSYMSMIKRFQYAIKNMEIGQYFEFYEQHINEVDRIIDFQRDYFNEFIVDKKLDKSVIFKKVR